MKAEISCEVQFKIKQPSEVLIAEPNFRERVFMCGTGVVFDVPDIKMMDTPTGKANFRRMTRDLLEHIKQQILKDKEFLKNSEVTL